MPKQYHIPQIICESCVELLTNAFAKHEVQDFTISHTSKILEIHGDSPYSTEALNEMLDKEGLSKRYKVEEINKKEEKKEEKKIQDGTSVQWKIYEYLHTYRQLLKIFLLLLVFSILTGILQKGGSIFVMLSYFMGSYFLVFGAVKMLSLRNVTSNFSQYDLLGKFVPFYGLLFPFLEVALSIVYFSRRFVLWPEAISIIIFLSTFLGVSYRLWKKLPLIKCACFGDLIDLSISSFTLVENGAMILCAIAMLIIEIVYRL